MQIESLGYEAGCLKDDHFCSMRSIECNDPIRILLELFQIMKYFYSSRRYHSMCTVNINDILPTTHTAGRSP